MIEPDMLLRYIRIFSELSGQLRYATQKRVMLEVALIKLCTPAMENGSGFSSGPDPRGGGESGERDGRVRAQRGRAAWCM